MESFWELIRDTFVLFGKVLLACLILRVVIYMLGVKIYVPLMDPAIGWLLYKLTGTAQIGPWGAF